MVIGQHENLQVVNNNNNNDNKQNKNKSNNILGEVLALFKL